MTANRAGSRFVIPAYWQNSHSHGGSGQWVHPASGTVLPRGTYSQPCGPCGRSSSQACQKTAPVLGSNMYSSSGPTQNAGRSTVRACSSVIFGWSPTAPPCPMCFVLPARQCTPHSPRLPRPILDRIDRRPWLARQEQPVPAPQLADRLPDLHVIDLDRAQGAQAARGRVDSAPSRTDTPHTTNAPPWAPGVPCR